MVWSTSLAGLISISRSAGSSCERKISRYSTSGSRTGATSWILRLCRCALQPRPFRSWPAMLLLASEVTHKPIARELRDLLEGAWLFEQMRRARYDVDLDLAAHFRTRLLIYVDHDVIFAAHDQQGRRFHLG